MFNTHGRSYDRDCVNVWDVQLFEHRRRYTKSIYDSAISIMTNTPVPPHSEQVLVQFPVEHALLLTMNRPKALNAMTPVMESDINTLMNWFDEEPSLWSVCPIFRLSAQLPSLASVVWFKPHLFWIHALCWYFNTNNCGQGMHSDGCGTGVLCWCGSRSVSFRLRS